MMSPTFTSSLLFLYSMGGESDIVVFLLNYSYKFTCQLKFIVLCTNIFVEKFKLHITIDWRILLYTSIVKHIFCVLMCWPQHPLLLLYFMGKKLKLHITTDQRILLFIYVVRMTKTSYSEPLHQNTIHTMLDCTAYKDITSIQHCWVNSSFAAFLTMPQSSNRLDCVYRTG